jgi:hypothetical protein
MSATPSNDVMLKAPAADAASAGAARPVPADRESNPPGSGTAANDMNELTVRLETDFCALEPLRQSWDNAVAELGGTVYMTYDWCRTWWEFYGTGKQLRLFLFQSAEKIVGVLPLYIDRIGIWPARLAVARLVGYNIPPKTFNPPIHPAWAEKIFRSVLLRLFEEDRCDMLSFGPVSEEHVPTRTLEDVARKETGLVSGVTAEAGGVCSVFALPKTLDQYFESLDKDERKKRKYELRLLRREHPITEDVLSDPARIETEFDEFARLHALQWKDKGKLGHFGSWPKALEFNRALVQSQGRLGRVRFVRILADGQVISSQFAFAFGNSVFWELPARVTGPKWQRFSLGPAGFFSLVDHAIKEGKTRVEAGLAHYDYKQKLNAREFPVRTVRLNGRGTGSRIRTQLFRALRTFLLWTYYKIWYARVSPRLPAFLRRPLWSFWLRMDF